MRSFKAVFGLIAALLPIGYCGYLLLYFKDVSGEAGPVQTGLGPTMLGLGAVGLLFCIPVLLKIVKLLANAGATAPGDGKTFEAENTFDADAALARYLARKAAAGEEMPVPIPDAPPRGGFGRKPV